MRWVFSAQSVPSVGRLELTRGGGDRGSDGLVGGLHGNHFDQEVATTIEEAIDR